MLLVWITMKDTTYTITFQDADGNDLYSKNVIRTTIEEVDSLAYYIVNTGSHDATTYTINAK